MRQRDLLHLTHIAAFQAFCEAAGWQVEPVKGAFEILRMRKAGEPDPLIVHRRDNAREHVTTWGASETMAIRFYALSRGERRRRVAALV